MMGMTLHVDPYFRACLVRTSDQAQENPRKFKFQLDLAGLHQLHCVLFFVRPWAHESLCLNIFSSDSSSGFSAVSGSDLGGAFNKISEAEQLLDLSQIK